MLRKVPEDPFLRRQRLLLRSAELRMAIVGQSQVLKAPLALGAQVHTGVQWLYRHPEWPLGVFVALAVARPQRALRWAGRLLWAWTSLQRAPRWLAAVPLRPV